MIRREFIEPNFLAEVTNLHETPLRRVKRLERGTSPDDVERALKAEGLKVHEIVAYDFNEWRKRAAKTTQRVLVDYPAARAAGKKYEFKPDLWRELKDYLFRLFDNRCAYCEADTRVVGPGDVEHYRPKARVEEEEDHLGYYWLAYEVDNYLPCCRECNAARGKRNHFPLADPKKRASSPIANLGDELPLLFNPLHHDISAEINFKLRFAGEIPICVAVTRGGGAVGSKSIGIYNLNRGEVLEKRGQECARALGDVCTSFATLGRSVALKNFEASLRRRQFPSACAEIVRDGTNWR